MPSAASGSPPCASVCTATPMAASTIAAQPARPIRSRNSSMPAATLSNGFR